MSCFNCEFFSDIYVIGLEISSAGCIMCIKSSLIYTSITCIYNRMMSRGSPKYDPHLVEGLRDISTTNYYYAKFYCLCNFLTLQSFQYYRKYIRLTSFITGIAYLISRMVEHASVRGGFTLNLP